MLWRRFPMLKSRITEHVAEIYLLARLLLSSYQPKMIAALKRWSPDSGQGLSRPPTLICGVISAKNVFKPKSHQWMHLFWVYKNYVGIPGNQHFAGNMVIRHVTKRFSQSFLKKRFAKLLENYPWYHFLTVFLVSAFYANSNRTDESSCWQWPRPPTMGLGDGQLLFPSECDKFVRMSWRKDKLWCVCVWMPNWLKKSRICYGIDSVYSMIYVRTSNKQMCSTT